MHLMSDRPDIEIRMISQPRYVCAVRRAIEALADSQGMSKQDAADLALAISEAMANVIKHGYDGQIDRPINIQVSPINPNGRKGLKIVIEDECEQVSLSQIQGRPLDEVRPGGLGIHLIERIMDQVQYAHRQSGQGMRLTMCKFIDAQKTVSER